MIYAGKFSPEISGGRMKKLHGIDALDINTVKKLVLIGHVF